jgi:MoaA/NifB/PqqE/SkfB family radical SAM enzyme
MEASCQNEGAGINTDPFRTIQIHPTKKCNLTCLHCYSSSSPAHKEMLDVRALNRFLEYAYEDGFNNIAVSGGEPFLYKDLEELLKFTKSLGYQNTLASNGMLLQSEHNRKILEYVDLIAISIDGPEELHDYIRGLKGAFNKMLNGVDVLRALDKPFGFIHTVTPQSWESLIWLGEFAFEKGAKLLQLHPLEQYGRAVEELSGYSVDDTLAHQAFILTSYLRSKYDGKMVIQLDLLHRDYLESFPEAVNSFERECAQNGKLSDMFDTIIVEETGRILPLVYGFEPEFTIGNVHNFETKMFEEFISGKVPEIKALFDRTLNKIFSNKDIDIVNWNEMLVNESKCMPSKIPAQ